ncbi:MAG: LamG domain-containing protein, partial [Isosphaeraceae bacterium]
PDAIAPAGPVDPGLTVLSAQSRAGRPIAVLANYSMHYYGATPVSADYYGRFAAALARRIGAADKTAEPQFVGIMSQGTSGDQMWMDYGQPKKDPGLDAYADGVAGYAEKAYRAIAYRDWVPLAMAESTLVLGRRLPDEKRLAWARSVVAKMKDREQPGSLPEVYAKEAIYLHDEPSRELKLQAIRIGDMGITAIPNEVYAITGLKLKAQSPFDTTMNVELANGSEGYIPPPEQHALGGYTTWPARTAGLEVPAEPKIAAAVLKLLEQVAGKPRRILALAHGAYAKAVLASKPMAYWRLDDIRGPIAFDSSGNGRHARYENGVAFYLPGADAPGLSADKSTNRAAHLAGGRLEAKLDGLPENYTVELWFWKGLPNQARTAAGDRARTTAGVLVSLVLERGRTSTGDDIGVDGMLSKPGLLFLTTNLTDKVNVNNASYWTGETEIAPRTWHHLAMVRSGRRVSLYLDGKSEPEISGIDGLAPAKGPRVGRGAPDPALFIGGRGDGSGNTRFEGKIDEVALYDRALDADEIAAHVRAANAR